MKYSVENLLRIREDNIDLKGHIGVELSGLIARAINIKCELEKVEEKLLTPARTDKDIFNHAQLIKDYKENRQNQIKVLLGSGALFKDISLSLEKDYEETVKLIKG
ncbi:MAG: hypothetical protein K2H30_03040 [Clostridia bacterium]|nr:hypothetical protein [Clostridia bacterium]